jgi:hypothetical protein
VTRVDTAQDHERAAMVHTLRVGLVSALLVLGLFAMALLVLAQLQP